MSADKEKQFRAVREMCRPCYWSIGGNCGLKGVDFETQIERGKDGRCDDAAGTAKIPSFRTFGGKTEIFCYGSVSRTRKHGQWKFVLRKTPRFKDTAWRDWMFYKF